MAYIVESSLDIGGKIIPGNEVQINKLIKEKEEFLKENGIAEPTADEIMARREEETEELTKQDNEEKNLKKNKKKMR